MRNVKIFDDFIKRGVVKKVPVDSKRMMSFISKSERKNYSLRERINKIEITDGNAEDYIESCYDILMLLIRAKMSKDGFSAVGLGAHEAEVSYLRNLDFNENEVQFADQLRYFRNGILYYDTELDKDYAQKVIDFLEKIYPRLRKILSL